MGKWKHRILSTNAEAGRVVCEACGEVDLVINRGRPACSVAALDRRAKRTPEQNQQYRATYRAKHPERYREQSRRFSRGAHGLTVEEAAEYREGKVCSICGTDQNLAVDHDHETGRVRGVLCRSCNVGLGLFKDDVGRLARAIEYLAE